MKENNTAQTAQEKFPVQNSEISNGYPESVMKGMYPGNYPKTTIQRMVSSVSSASHLIKTGISSYAKKDLLQKRSKPIIQMKTGKYLSNIIQMKKLPNGAEINEFGEDPLIETNGEVLFNPVLGEQDDTSISALWAHSLRGPYYTFPTSYGLDHKDNDAKEARGDYLFAISSANPREVLVSKYGGHSSLVKYGKVRFAGNVTISDGVVEDWDNDSGHYKCPAEYVGQAQQALTDDMASPLLPIDKFIDKDPT
jgi:hypothetical protein